MATVKAQLPGIFYRRPSPEEHPYVDEGQRVGKGQVIGLVEVMKTFNELAADEEGTLLRFFVDDAEEITVGQDIAELSP